MPGVCNYVGVFYPRATEVVDNGLPGYRLSAAELQTIAAQLPCLPVTYEHKGIATACAALAARSAPCTPDNVLDGLKAAARSDALRAPVGAVVAAWQAAAGEWLCWFAVDSARFPRLCALIDARAVRGLSLSHLHGATVSALEVSLCQTPARPGSYVCAGPFSAPCHVQRYKEASLLPRPHPHPAMSTPAAPAPAPTDQQAPTLESVLQSMNPAERTLISAAFGDMTKQLDETTRKNDTLKAQYSRIEQAAKVDKKLLTAQIETFINQLDDATRTQFNLSVEGCKADIVEENDAGAIRRNVDRMLMC